MSAVKFGTRFLARSAFNHLAQRVVLPDGRSLGKPIRIALQPTVRCDSRCRMCHIFKLKDPDLTLDVAVRTLASLKEWLGTPFFVYFVGGETLQYPDIHPLVRFCRRNNIIPKIQTNGALLTSDNCRRLVDDGLSRISISVDSLDPDVHDALRGMPGILDKALAGVRTLADNGVKVGITVVVSSRNAGELGDMAAVLLKEFGAARIVFQPVEPVYASNIGRREFARHDLWVRDLAALESSIARLVELKAEGFDIVNTEADFQGFLTYFRDPFAARPEGRCLVSAANYFVDVRGDARFCWPFEPFANAHAPDFDAGASWNCAKARVLRLKSLTCRRNCTAGCHKAPSMAEKIGYYLFHRRD